MRANVAGAAGGAIRPVLVSPVKKAKEGAGPHLGRFAYWNLEEFRAWADQSIDAVRDLRRTFTAPGDLDWRAQAAEKLEAARADAPGLFAWLGARPASDHLKIVK